MLSEGRNRQRKMEFVYIEDLVPKDHILRKIDKYIDFSFINDLCRPYYCENNGRPAIEPEIMFKMLFIGYLFGIRSETRLVEDVKVNIAYRWFLGYGIEDKIPDASVIWQNRLRRFNGTDIPRQIFENILITAAVQNMKRIANILWKRDLHFLSTRIKNLICMTKTHPGMVGLSVIWELFQLKQLRLFLCFLFASCTINAHSMRFRNSSQPYSYTPLIEPVA
mgnify:CR=1 FL=1